MSSSSKKNRVNASTVGSPSCTKGISQAPEATDTTPSIADFERDLEALEALVNRMEEGPLNLEASLAAFERGIILYRRCRQALDKAELQVRLLLDPESPDSAQPFEYEA